MPSPANSPIVELVTNSAGTIAQSPTQPALITLNDLFVSGYTAGDVFNVAGDFREADNEPHALDFLKLLDPVVMDATYRHKCMPGTRQAILESLSFDLTTPFYENKLLWLTGVAGSGKSTIATTVAERLRDQGQLGAFLFFDRNSPSLNRPDAVIRTLAFQLAMFNKALRDAICEVIDQDPQIATRTLSHQFSHLLLGPLQSCSTEITKPIVIILDAFDECGDPLSRRSLAYLIAENILLLPHFRFLITGRPQLDLINMFSSRPQVKSISLNAPEWTSEADVLLYIQHEMDRLYHLRHASDDMPPGWPGMSKVQQMSARAADSFIYAATAMRYLYSADDVNGRLDSLLEQTAFTLEDLYATALRSASNWDPGEIATDSCLKILGAVVVSRIALADDAIVDILGFEESKACRLVLRNLACVLQWSEGLPVRTLHASFADYLTDPSSCAGQPWFINVHKYHSEFTVGCLRVMKRLLRFNICGLETSHLANKHIREHNKNQMQSTITPALSYSCRFLGDHVELTAQDNVVHREVCEFLLDQFLYWLEVLSLEKHINTASRSLSSILTWTQRNNPSLTKVVKDAIRFVNVFAPAISESAPHIYVSALPFAPKDSLIAERYSWQYPGVLRLQSGSLDSWPSDLKIIEGHKDRVTSVAYSPDGKHIVSGALDTSIWIWDAQTGESVVGPLKGHNNCVTSVKYSADGRHIVSGSWDGTVRIWDALTGEKVAGPFRGHTDWVNSVAWSPDGHRVVSGSYDNTCRVWNVETDRPAARTLFKGHGSSVESVTYSPDGNRIAYGSSDGTIGVWDTETGEIVGVPFEGHAKGVVSIAYSPDGSHIASGSSDKTVRIWDTATGEPVGKPFEGHTDTITSIAYSADGRLIASSSDDKTVHVYDTQKGVMAVGPFQGHTQGVNSVAFSPDGMYIVSGANDNTVRVWDAESFGITARTVEEDRSGWVLAVACSPDGKHIASGSADGSIRIWNLETGKLVLGPLEGHGDWARSITYSPDGKRIVSGSYDKTIRIWSAEKGTVVAGPFRGHEHFVVAVACSPDGKHVVSSSFDKTIRVWDASTGEIALGPLTGHSGEVNTVAYSPDGKCIASGSWDGTIRIWDTETGKMVVGPLEGHSGAVLSVAFSPDGQCVASGSIDEAIRIWDIQTGQIVASPFRGHSGFVNSVVYSPDGKYITSCSNDKTIRIWDGETGDIIAGPFGHNEAVRSVAYSPDGKHIVSSSTDSTIRVWGVDQALAAGSASLRYVVPISAS
ncbi:hypothetical protein HWV62_25725 [Athelia sp. TMB]|nr:hypothetical protein HWV62_25725 [Athelia sp. TMB]